MNNQTLKNAYLEQLQLIKVQKSSYKTKIKLIQGLTEKLRFMDSNPELMVLGSVQKTFIYSTPQAKRSLFTKKQNGSQNQSTSYSFYSDNSQTVGVGSTQDYEQIIMEKRVIKFEINEQIEALEDDLFEIEKVVETKRAFNDELAKNIQKRMKQIGQNVKTTKQDTSSFLSKTSTKIHKKDYNSNDPMNMTVSGASGFGFVKKNNHSNLNSLNLSKNQISLCHINVDSSAVQRKKTKSNLSKSITGIFKNILK